MMSTFFRLSAAVLPISTRGRKSDVAVSVFLEVVTGLRVAGSMAEECDAPCQYTTSY